LNVEQAKACHLYMSTLDFVFSSFAKCTTECKLCNDFLALLVERPFLCLLPLSCAYRHWYTVARLTLIYSVSATVMSSPTNNKDSEHRKSYEFYYDQMRFGKPSASFRSSQPRLPPALDNGVPPPGSYNVPSPLTKAVSPKGRSPMHSSSPRFLSSSSSPSSPTNLPSPTSPLSASQFLRPGSASPSAAASPASAFGGTSGRFTSFSHEDIPGPGSYAPPSAFAQPKQRSAASASFKSSSPRISNFSDGRASTDPGLYHPSPMSSRASAASASFKASSPRVQVSKSDTPPVGHYTPRDAFLGSNVRRS
jgi:hypothetical protein